MAKPQLAPAARDDIRDIRHYSKTVFGSRTAIDYIEGLRVSLHRIGEAPLTGRIESDLGTGLRSAGYRAHRIYYRIDRTPILIVRILHHARDIPSAFGPSQ